MKCVVELLFCRRKEEGKGLVSAFGCRRAIPKPDRLEAGGKRCVNPEKGMRVKPVKMERNRRNESRQRQTAARENSADRLMKTDDPACYRFPLEGWFYDHLF